MHTITLAQFGLGPIGLEALKLAATKPWIRVLGGIDIDPAKVGRPLAELTGGAVAGGSVHASFADLVAAAGRPDVVLHTAGSKAAVSLAQLRPVLEAGTSVASTCEELIFPRLYTPAETETADTLCRRTGARVVATGVNPGFAMDLMPVVAAAATRQVDAVRCVRVVDASTRRQPLQAKIGSGMAPEAFREKFRRGEAGHAGFRQSTALIAHALGWQLDGIEETCEPVVAERRVQTRFFNVEPGQTRGLHQRATGIVAGRVAIELDLTMALDEPNPHDTIRLQSQPPLELTFRGGIPGDVATIATLVNVVPRLLAAAPGVRLITELPVAAV